MLLIILKCLIQSPTLSTCDKPLISHNRSGKPVGKQTWKLLAHNMVRKSIETVGPLYPRFPHPWIQSAGDGKYLEKKIYVVADVYYVVRPTMVGSVLTTYRLFSSCHDSLNNTT